MREIKRATKTHKFLFYLLYLALIYSIAPQELPYSIYIYIHIQSQYSPSRLISNFSIFCITLFFTLETRLRIIVFDQFPCGFSGLSLKAVMRKIRTWMVLLALLGQRSSKTWRGAWRATLGKWWMNRMKRNHCMMTSTESVVLRAELHSSIRIYIYIHIYTFVVLLGNQYRFSPLATKPIKKVLFPIVSGKSGSLMVFLIQYPGTAMVKMHWNMWHLPYNLQQELNIKNPSIYIYLLMYAY